MLGANHAGLVREGLGFEICWLASLLRGKEQMDPRVLWPSFCFEVLQATTMLFYLLSGIAINRPKHPSAAPGMGFVLPLPGLPGLCISPCIGGTSDDDLYGEAGAAVRIAFKGWVVEVYDGIWEHNYRDIMRNMYAGDGGFQPQLDALGDLRHIRNDIVHNNSVASKGSSGQCKVLRWFKPGDKITLELRHVLDFLNQIGALIGKHQYNNFGGFHTVSIPHTKKALLAWNPEPKPISVRTSLGPIDDPFLCLHIVFGNGLFCNTPVAFPPLEGSLLRRRDLLKEAKIDADGNFVFVDGSVLEYRQIYVNAVNTWCDPSFEKQNRGPVHGPWIKIGK